MRLCRLTRHLARTRLSLAVGGLAATLGWCSAIAADGPAKSTPPRVAILGAPAASEEELTAIATALALFTVVGNPEEAEVAIVWRGPGSAGSAVDAAFAGFLERPRPLVVLGADPAAWPGGASEVAALLGAAPGGSFAQGAAPTVLSDYGHPITTGVTEPLAPPPLRLWSGLTADTFVLQEATAGEETAPLAWIRQDGTRRLAYARPRAAGSSRRRSGGRSVDRYPARRPKCNEPCCPTRIPDPSRSPFPKEWASASIRSVGVSTTFGPANSRTCGRAG
jgi:hypothetical protein